MPRLLIVEDEEGVAEVLFDYFSTAGYTVDTAPNGVAAIGVMRDAPPDAVLLDLRLAQGALDGSDVLKAIRQGWPQVPVIMVTANVDEDAARATLELGAFDYVMKPFNLARLREIVAVAVAGRE